MVTLSWIGLVGFALIIGLLIGFDEGQRTGRRWERDRQRLWQR
jgi:hypothetical protein